MRIRRKFWINDSETIIAIMVVLMVLGTINVFSSSFVLATVSFENPYFFLERHLIWLVVGLVTFLGCRSINYHRWGSLRGLMLLVVILMVLMLAAVLVIGTEVNGARRWLTLGPLSLQPSEFAKLVALILAAGAIAQANRRGDSLFSWRYAPSFVVILLMFGLVELEPDMGTACVVLGTPVVMALTAAGLGLRYILGIVALAVAGIVGMILLQPYRLLRFQNMYDPWADAQGAGYQTVQSLSTIGSGGLFGMGLGDGVSKYEYLPEAHTDFAFAIFCQEQGFLGALFVFGLLTLLIIYIVRTARRAPDDFGQLLALGIMILICGQGIVNIWMVGGAFAVVGVPLPFISYGGSSLIVTMMAMGILLNICDKGVDPRKRDREEREREERLTEKRANVARSSFRLVK